VNSFQTESTWPGEAMTREGCASPPRGEPERA